MVQIRKGSLVSHPAWPNSVLKVLSKPGKGEVTDEIVTFTGLTTSIGCTDYVLCSVPNEPPYQKVSHYNNKPCIVLRLDYLTPYKKK